MLIGSKSLRGHCVAFIGNDEGATAIEYSLIATGMSSALITAFNALLDGGGLLGGIPDLLNPSAPPPPTPPMPPPMPLKKL